MASFMILELNFKLGPPSSLISPIIHYS